MMATSDNRDEDQPVGVKTAALSVLFGFVGLSLLGGAAWTLGVLIFDATFRAKANWALAIVIGVIVLVGTAALWASARLKPSTRHEPVSPATKKTHALFGLSGVVATIACVAVMIDTMDAQQPSNFFSNSPITLWVALFAIACWLISWVIAWLWYFSADEHEQRASDVGLLYGGLLFAVVTPVWWVAARAGLASQPNAMVLWFIVNVVWTIGWFWRRNR